MIEGVRAGKRSFFQRFFTDPLTGLIVIFFYFIFWLLPVDVASWLGEKMSYPLSWILPSGCAHICYSGTFFGHF